MPRPPLWSLGFHQSRYSYMSADEVREICGELRRRDIPASAVHLDIDYMDEYKVFTWHRKAFSRPEKLNADLRAKRIRTVAIVDPGVMVSPGYGPYDEGMAKGYFITGEDGKPVTGQTWPGLSHHPDFTMPAVREWWGRLVGEALLGRGVSGIWCDMNEPGVWDDIGFWHQDPARHPGRGAAPRRGRGGARTARCTTSTASAWRRRCTREWSGRGRTSGRLSSRDQATRGSSATRRSGPATIARLTGRCRST